jgi:neutral ceramidase
MNTKQFLAGAASVDITPPLGTRINGDFVSHVAHTIHDKLYSKALALKSGSETIVLVVVDTCYMQDDFLRPVRKEINLKTGLPEQNILFSCTHTHSAGAVADLLMGAADLPYTRKLPGLIIESVLNALAHMVPAQVGFGAIDVPEHVLCRRYFMKDGYQAYNPVSGSTDEVKTNPFGAEDQIEGPIAEMDTQLSYLAVQSTDGHWISLLANYSLHYVGDFGPGIISADYFGAFAREIKQTLGAGDEFVGILSNGTSGEANIWDFKNNKNYPTGDFKKSSFIANDLAIKIAASIEGLTWNLEFDISTAYEELWFPVNKPSAEELAAAKALVSISNCDHITSIDQDVLKKIYAREQILLEAGPDEEVLPVQAVRIGDVVIGALAGEFFAETGLWLKKNSPVKQYFSIGLANGVVGYVPPAHEIERGGYETWRCRTSKLQKGAETVVKERLLQLIHEVVHK